MFLAVLGNSLANDYTGIADRSRDRQDAEVTRR